MLPKRSNVVVVSEEDALRARFYGLLARLLGTAPDAELLVTLSQMDGDGSDIGRGLAALAAVAAGVTAEQAEEEFTALFIGLTEGDLRPYGSYYLTGFLYEKPLADLRWDLERLGIERAEGIVEPEDHVASLCEIMHGLIVGAFGTPADLATQRSFFETHVATWAPRFFEDLEMAPRAHLYRPVGAIGRTFMAVEREAFSMVG